MASDIWTEFEQLLTKMEWHEVVSTLIDVINDKAASPTPPPSPPSPPAPPSLLSLLSPSPPSPPTATSEHTDPPQLVYTVLDTPMVEAPPFFVETLPLCSSEVLEEHAVVVAAPAEASEEVLPEALAAAPPPGNQQQEPSDGQNAIILCDIYDQEKEFGEGQYDMHMFVDPSQMNQNLRPVGCLNGELVYEITPNDYGPCVYEPPPSFMYNPRKRRCPEEKGGNEPYIKKPLNAFMIFRKEERENVMAEVKITDSATINSILGRRWRSMSKQEQAKYYMMAKKEKQLHAQQYPNWSAVHNYGKKRRYDRSKAKALPKAGEKKD